MAPAFSRSGPCRRNRSAARQQRDLAGQAAGSSLPRRLRRRRGMHCSAGRHRSTTPSGAVRPAADRRRVARATCRAWRRRTAADEWRHRAGTCRQRALGHAGRLDRQMPRPRVAGCDRDDHVGAIEVVHGVVSRSWMPWAPPPRLMFAMSNPSWYAASSAFRMSSERASSHRPGRRCSCRAAPSAPRPICRTEPARRSPWRASEVAGHRAGDVRAVILNGRRVEAALVELVVEHPRRDHLVVGQLGSPSCGCPA